MTRCVVFGLRLHGARTTAAAKNMSWVPPTLGGRPSCRPSCRASARRRNSPNPHFESHRDRHLPTNGHTPPEAVRREMAPVRQPTAHPATSPNCAGWSQRSACGASARSNAGRATSTKPKKDNALNRVETPGSMSARTQPCHNDDDSASDRSPMGALRRAWAQTQP